MPASPQLPPHKQLLQEFEIWLEGHRAPGTIHQRVYYISRLMRWAEAQNLSVTDLTFDHLSRWLARAVGPAPHTKRSAKSSLSVFYSWATRTGKLPENIATGMPAMRAPRGVPNPCPEHILDAGLKRCTRPRDALMLLLGAYQGLRAGEIACLHTSDVRDDHLRVHGKGNKTRLVPLHPVIEEAVTYFDPGFFFPSPYSPTGHVLPASIGKRVRYLLGNTPGHHAHSLRHRFGVETLERTTDLMALRDLLGHSSVATTEIYTHASTDRLKHMVHTLPATPGHLHTLTKLVVEAKDT